MKIDVRLEFKDACETMLRIRNVILVCDTIPKAVFAWMDYARPAALFDADLQRIYSLVDAAMVGIKYHPRLNDGFDYKGALARVNAICKARIGEVN